MSILSAFVAITNCRVRIHSGAPAPATEPQNIVSAQIIAAAIKELLEKCMFCTNPGSTLEYLRPGSSVVRAPGYMPGGPGFKSQLGHVFL